MVAKLIAIIMTCAAVGSTTLAVRQQTLLAANTMIDIHRTLDAQDEALWRLHCEVSARTAPMHLREALASSDSYESVLFDWCDIGADPISDAAWPEAFQETGDGAG